MASLHAPCQVHTGQFTSSTKERIYCVCMRCIDNVTNTFFDKGATPRLPLAVLGPSVCTEVDALAQWHVGEQQQKLPSAKVTRQLMMRSDVPLLVSYPLHCNIQQPVVGSPNSCVVSISADIIEKSNFRTIRDHIFVTLKERKDHLEAVEKLDNFLFLKDSMKLDHLRSPLYRLRKGHKLWIAHSMVKNRVLYIERTKTYMFDTSIEYKDESKVLAIIEKDVPAMIKKIKEDPKCTLLDLLKSFDAKLTERKLDVDDRHWFVRTEALPTKDKAAISKELSMMSFPLTSDHSQRYSQVMDTQFYTVTGKCIAELLYVDRIESCCTKELTKHKKLYRLPARPYDDRSVLLQHWYKTRQIEQYFKRRYADWYNQLTFQDQIAVLNKCSSFLVDRSDVCVVVHLDKNKIRSKDGSQVQSAFLLVKKRWTQKEMNDVMKEYKDLVYKIPVIDEAKLKALSIDNRTSEECYAAIQFQRARHKLKDSEQPFNQYVAVTKLNYSIDHQIEIADLLSKIKPTEIRGGRYDQSPAYNYFFDWVHDNLMIDVEDQNEDELIESLILLFRSGPAAPLPTASNGLQAALRAKRGERYMDLTSCLKSACNFIGTNGSNQAIIDVSYTYDAPWVKHILRRISREFLRRSYYRHVLECEEVESIIRPQVCELCSAYLYDGTGVEGVREQSDPDEKFSSTLEVDASAPQSLAIRSTYFDDTLGDVIITWSGVNPTAEGKLLRNEYDHGTDRKWHELAKKEL